MGAGGRGAAPPGLACPPPDPNHKTEVTNRDPILGLGLTFTGTEVAVCPEKPGLIEPCASDQPDGGGRMEGVQVGLNTVTVPV